MFIKSGARPSYPGRPNLDEGENKNQESIMCPGAKVTMSKTLYRLSTGLQPYTLLLLLLWGVVFFTLFFLSFISCLPFFQMTDVTLQPRCAYACVCLYWLLRQRLMCAERFRILEPSKHSPSIMDRNMCHVSLSGWSDCDLVKLLMVDLLMIALTCVFRTASLQQWDLHIDTAAVLKPLRIRKSRLLEFTFQNNTGIFSFTYRVFQPDRVPIIIIPESTS